MNNCNDRRLIYPLNSKASVNRAAKNIVYALQNGNTTNEEDELIIENWRASHAHVLNTWQVIFRKRVKSRDIVFAQRLKRKNTIYDKLQRFPQMDFARMHDIAGCRLIFKNAKTLYEFVKVVHSSNFKHVLKANECKDYIKNPKESGYRGLHDVYLYQTRRGYDNSNKWNGLSVEIQYRTIYQHAWATAVEVADSLTRCRTKFSEGDRKQYEFFQLASEIIARAYENMHSCRPDLTDEGLVNNFLAIENEILLLKRLKQLKAIHKADIFKKNTIIVFDIVEQGFPCSKIITFDNFQQANREYFRLEKEYPKSDIVLVSSNDKQVNKSIQNAYRNYFADTTDFTAYIDNGISKLVKH